ncbi:YggS family pyridoxal phosphate-dependent enzyme [Gayadomonas joobiniege]|uniref:YggS family pyridoxal phosphate-dependent enzyme n=1 Tax=Gayadomonas joobiniege TaxID=1234606 RepID=UPI00037AC41D|nr:YggS family pyridoxal phosphate-dependent enzyme [Gayadomonas joobiniege]
MTAIEQNLAKICQQIARLNQTSGQHTQLLAVSKTKPVKAIQDAYNAGQRLFGENYVQEGIDKIKTLSNLTDIEWHFIGPLQSNKTRLVAEHFAWVQSVDRFKIAKRLSEQRPSQLGPLNICLQVNISGEETKSGITPDQVLPLAEQVAQLEHLTLRGLMAIPMKTQNVETTQRYFAQLAELYRILGQKYSSVDTLSMGMSNDMQTAIEQGSTMVRVGTAIFGERI